MCLCVNEAQLRSTTVEEITDNMLQERQVLGEIKKDIKMTNLKSHMHQYLLDERYFFLY